MVNLSMLSVSRPRILRLVYRVPAVANIDGVALRGFVYLRIH